MAENAKITNPNAPKNNAAKTGTEGVNNITKLGNNNLNKEISNILGNTPKAENAKPNNTKTNINKNNNNNNNNDNNDNNNKKPNNAVSVSNTGNTGININKKNNDVKNQSVQEPSMLEQSVNKIGNTFANIKNSVLGVPTENKTSKNNKNRLSEIEESVMEEPVKRNNTRATNTREEGQSIWMLVIKVVIVVIVLVAIYYIGNYLITKYLNASVNSPMLLNTTKNAKNALVVSQDPTSINYIPIKKSDGQDGIQFTYGFWFLIESMEYKKGEWKHMFHKGNSSSYPNRAPGVWIHPDKNSIRVYMNTMDNILEYGDIDNIPIRKWVYMNVILTNKNLDLYINGYLKVRKELSSIPKQNDDDFWVNMYGGFEGYLSNIRYYAYAIDFNEIYKNIKAGPSTNNCIDTGEVPPYLDDNWWFDYNG